MVCYKENIKMKASFWYQMFHVMILDSLVLKCRIGLHILLFYPMGFMSFVFSTWNQMSNEGQQTYSRVTLITYHPATFSLVALIIFT